MAFLNDIIFPDELSYSTQIGASFKTDVITFGRGREQRNAVLDSALHRVNAAENLKTNEQFEELKTIFLIAMGKEFSFRLRDPLDHKSCSLSQVISATDQQIGVGNGSTTQFQLTKTYSKASRSYVREIEAPVLGTLRIAFDGVEQATGFSLNDQTGVVTFTTAPATDVVITAGYEYHLKMRFDTDDLMNSVEAYQSNNVNIPLVEVLKEEA